MRKIVMFSARDIEALVDGATVSLDGDSFKAKGCENLVLGHVKDMEVAQRTGQLAAYNRVLAVFRTEMLSLSVEIVEDIIETDRIKEEGADG